MDCIYPALEDKSTDLTILDLPDDAILAILSWCDLRTTLNVSCVCRRLYHLASDDALWKKYAVNTVVVKPNYKRRIVPWKKLWMTSMRWSNGKCKEVQMLSFRQTNLMPWIQISNNDSAMLLSQGPELHVFLRWRPRKLHSSPRLRLTGHSDDIVKFVKRGPDVYTGSIDKTVRIWSFSGKSCSGVLTGHTKGVYCVDGYQDVIVSGSRDKTLKIWSKRALCCLETVPTYDHVWCLCMNPSLDEFLCGTAAHDVNAAALRVYDLESGSIISGLTDRANGHQSLGAGILQLKMEDPHTVMSCGYDTTVRLWDLRSNSCVLSWEDPHDNVVYSIDSNKQWMILSGTSRYGVVRLWDKRMPLSVRSYFTGKGRGNSPVYSLQFTPTKLYVALSHGIQMLDFVY